jgi:outer membrane protein OmpA-like peptidoglycan-associated protein
MLRRVVRSALSVLMTWGVAVATVLPATPARAGSVSTSYTASVSYPAPSSQFTGASAGGDGYAVAIYGTRVYNIFHHQTYLGLMCHNQSDASACWNSTDTGSGNPYKTITAVVSGATATFGTTGKVGLYVDQATGYLYVYAVRDDGSYRQPGVVCINLNAADTVTDPACSGSGQPPAWTPLAANGDTAWSTGNTPAGTTSPLAYNGHLYAWNPVSGSAASTGGGGATGNGDNALLCYDIAAQAPCSAEPYVVSVSASSTATNADTSNPAPADTLVGSRYFIPTAWSTGGVLACVDLSLPTPGNCAGNWPQAASVPQEAVAIPSLDASGNIIGVCESPSGTWTCWGLDGSSQPTPTGLTAATLQTTSWDNSPVVVGTRVLLAFQSTRQIYCYDFATNAACTTTSGTYPITLSNVNTVYTVNADPERPTCVWTNADNGVDQIQNFDALTGGSCAAAPVRIFASSFVEPYQACLPTAFTSISLTAGNFLTSPAPTLSFTNGNGVVIDGPYNFNVSGATPSIDLTSLSYTTPIDLSTQNALPQFVLNLAPGTGGLGTVTVQVSWSGTGLNQCTPGYSGPAPSTSAASSISDTSATFNGLVNNTSSDTVSPVTFCYQTTSFTSSNCSGATVSAVAGATSASVTPFSTSVTGLSPSTTYYYELVATDATTNTPLYGGVQSFTTGPVATTGPVTSLTNTSATLTGSLYNPAGDTVTAPTMCYQSTSFASGACAGTSSAAIAGTTSGAQTSYSLGVSGLHPGSTYYYEFSVTDSSASRTLYGGVREFVAAPVTTTTGANAISDHAATLTGTVYNPTGDTISASFCYQTTSFASGACTGTTTAALAGTTVASTTPFSANVAALASGTTYYYELSVGDSSTGTSFVGGVRSFTTGPIATTNAAISLAEYGATLVGSVYNPAPDTLASVAFCYQAAPFTSGGCTGTVALASAGTASGATRPYTLAVGGLATATRYYYELIVSDATTATTYDGGVRSFTTGASATTDGAANVQATQATLSGHVNNPALDTLTGVTFCYQATPFTSGTCTGTVASASPGVTSGTTTPESFVASALTPETTYFYELVVVDASTGATLFGGVQSLTTPSVPSAPRNVQASHNGPTVVASWTTPSSDGGSPILGYVCRLMYGFSTPSTFTVTTSVTTCSFGGVDPASTYLVKVYAFNAVGESTSVTAVATPVPTPTPGTGTGGTGAGGHTPGPTSGGTTLVAHWGAVTGVGLSQAPTYLVTLEPSGRTCTTTATSCRFGGLNAKVHYTYHVTVAIEIVPFAENSSALVGNLLTQTATLVRDIERWHPSSVTLAGFTDAFASASYNVALSSRRTHAVAAKVAATLARAGVHVPQIRFLALGKTHPVVSNASIRAAAGNRRVEVTFSMR